MPEDKLATQDEPTPQEVDSAAETDAEEMDDDEKLRARLKESMTVSLEEVGPLRKRLTVSVPQEVIAEQRNKQLGELKRDTILPGFRKGHAPMALVEKRFGTDVNSQLSGGLLSTSYLVAVEMENLKTLGDPQIWAKDPKSEDADTEKLVELNDAVDLIKLPNDEPLTYRCEVEVRPEFELPPLEDIEIEVPSLTVTDEMVEEQLQQTRKALGHYQPVESGTIQADDLVTCHFKASVDGEVIHEEQNVQLAARPMAYAHLMLKDLGTELVGAQQEDSRTLTVEIADDYPRESVRGKQAQVDLEILEFKRLILPELNDEETLDRLGFESPDELREWAKARLESSLANEIQELKHQRLSKYLLDQISMELPVDLSQRQSDRVAARRMIDLSRRGVPETEIAKHLDEIKSGAAKDAVNDLKLFFIMEKIADEWEIQVSEEEINSQIAYIAQRQNRRFDRVRDDLIRNQTLHTLYLQVRDAKIYDLMLDKARITEVEPKKEKKESK